MELVGIRDTTETTITGVEMFRKILDEGIAIRGSDIDVVWVNGYGWPIYRGGPMHWADSVGLAEIAAKIADYGERLGGRHWNLSPLLERLAAEGGSLAGHQNG